MDAAVGLVPGLAAQSRVGNNRELISLRQTGRLAAERYFAVTSNFESEQPGWKFWQYFRGIGDRAKDALADLVFEGRNDLVVDTGSMVDLADGLRIPSEQVLDFGTTDRIHHTNYFSQPDTLAFIEEMLTYGPPRAAAAAPKMSSIRRGRGILVTRAPQADRETTAERHAVELPSRRIAPHPRIRKPGGEDISIPRQTQQQQQQEMAPPPKPRALRRTPHLDLDPPTAVAPETIIRVRVYADRQAARNGEESEDIVVELPPDVRSVSLNTHLLVSPQLEIVGPMTQPLKIDVGQDLSSDALFKVRVRSRDEIAALMPELPSVKRASISAVFNYQGRPGGSVTRIVPLDLDFVVPPDAPDVTERVAAGTLRIEPEAKPADLLVQVRTQPINDGRQFQCWVSTPLIVAEEEDHWVDWNLPEKAESIVRGYMANFVEEDATPLERLSSLKGAGRQLFDAAPANFKSLYWNLVDAGCPPETIAIVSDEPYIPWELMIPHRRRKGRSESSEALGVAAMVGRWVLGDGCAGPQHLPLSDSIVIAPRYRGKNALPHAEEEASYVIEHFPGLRIEPATLETIDEAFGRHRGSILHLSCHGVDSADSPARGLRLRSRT